MFIKIMNIFFKGMDVNLKHHALKLWDGWQMNWVECQKDSSFLQTGMFCSSKWTIMR